MRKVIFWDFDGTLTTGQLTWRSCLMRALGPLAEQYGVTEEMLRPHLQNGFPWHPDGDPTLTGTAFWEALDRLFADAFRRLGIPAPEAEAAARRVRDAILDPGYYHLRPDAVSTLAACAEMGWQNYILSNNYPELEQLITALGLREHFAELVVSGLVGACKPDIKIFRLAEQVAGSPDIIWMAGDNPIADIKGAKDAGWHTAHMARQGAGDSGAEVTVTALEQLLSFL